jgi:hypothetical protein
LRSLSPETPPALAIFIRTAMGFDVLHLTIALKS